MAKKKNTPISVSQEKTAQAQHVFEHYHQITHNLHASKDQKQVETALTEINNLPESAQLALLKELSKEHQVDAADVLIALNELSPLKSVRKEARRSLIRLEGTKIYPRWKPPIDRTPPISAIQPSTNPPRFWKGLVDTDATGEAQLLLFWEQGEDYKEVCILGFYLNLRHEGVKDSFTNIDSKRGTERYIAQIAAKTPTLEWKNCSLVEGRHLLRKALIVHARHGTTPPGNYRSNLPLINQLIMEVEGVALDEKSSILHGLDPQRTVISFIEVWAREVYGTAYDLLSHDSPLREGLSRDEWIERRKAWAEEAEPSGLEPGYIIEHEHHKSILWLPESFNQGYSAIHKEVEAGWSLEMDDIPLSDPLPELPQTTAIYEETQRHWFWASYILVQENGDWRIQSMTDESIIAQNLSIEDLQKEQQELDDQMGAFVKKYARAKALQLDDEDAEIYLDEMSIRMKQAIYYTDALIKKLPFDQSHYEDAANRMVSLGHFERCIAYLTQMTRRFPEKRGLYLRRKALVEQRISRAYSDQEDESQAEYYKELAQESLRESLAAENTFEAHISLAELLVGAKELDEAEDHLLQAKDLVTIAEEAAMRLGQGTMIDEDGYEIPFSEKQAQIEFHLGEIAAGREEYRKALSYYQRAIELEPDSGNAWFAAGEAHQALEHFEEAETNYKRAIELEPESIGYYYRFSQMHAKNDQPSKAIKVLEEGLIANPDSVVLRIYIALLYMEMDDYRQAEIFLNKAEHIDPESPLVRSFREVLNSKKLEQTSATNKQSKPVKQKKKRR